MSKKKALSVLLCLILAGLLMVGGITYFFDPFYQYHKPIFGMDAVLYDRDNQVIGTIRTFDYDMVLLGSSVVENTDSAFLDEEYDGQTLKIIRASGSTLPEESTRISGSTKDILVHGYFCIICVRRDNSLRGVDSTISLYGKPVG